MRLECWTGRAEADSAPIEDAIMRANLIDTIVELIVIVIDM